MYRLQKRNTFTIRMTYECLNPLLVHTGVTAQVMAASTPLPLPPESLPSYCCDNFLVTNTATLWDQPVMWSEGSWQSTNTEQFTGFLLLLSSLQFQM